MLQLEICHLPMLKDIFKKLLKKLSYVFYKCYRKFIHSHNYLLGDYDYTNLKIDEAIKYIKKQNLAIMIPTL